MNAMPLIRFDMLEGRTEQEITKLLDVAHNVMVECFQVPEGDRYQLVSQHKPYEMIVKDTGLGFERTNNVIVLTVTSRPRTTEQKQNFYSQLTEALQEECGIDPKDVMVSFVINDDEDWSFGFGRAQFLTGEL